MYIVQCIIVFNYNEFQNFSGILRKNVTITEITYHHRARRQNKTRFLIIKGTFDLILNKFLAQDALVTQLKMILKMFF